MLKIETYRILSVVIGIGKDQSLMDEIQIYRFDDTIIIINKKNSPLSDNQAAIPGDKIAIIEEYEAGKNTFEDGHNVWQL